MSLQCIPPLAFPPDEFYISISMHRLSSPIILITLCPLTNKDREYQRDQVLEMKFQLPRVFDLVHEHKIYTHSNRNRLVKSLSLLLNGIVTQLSVDFFFFLYFFPSPPSAWSLSKPRQRRPGKTNSSNTQAASLLSHDLNMYILYEYTSWCCAKSLGLIAELVKRENGCNKSENPCSCAVKLVE